MSLIHKPASSKPFQQYLQPGESIQWVGRPGLKKREPVLPRKNMWKGIAWCIVGTVIAAIFLPDAIKHGGFKLFLYWYFKIGSKTQWTRDERLLGVSGQFFTLVGLLLLVLGAIYIYVYRSSAKPLRIEIRYALTNRRAILLNAIPDSKFAVYDLAVITPEITRENEDGSGTILLKGPEFDIGSAIKGIPSEFLDGFVAKADLEKLSSAKGSPGFLNVPDVRVVRDLMMQLKMQLPVKS